MENYNLNQQNFNYFYPYNYYYNYQYSTLPYQNYGFSSDYTSQIDYSYMNNSIATDNSTNSTLTTTTTSSPVSTTTSNNLTSDDSLRNSPQPGYTSPHTSDNSSPEINSESKEKVKRETKSKRRSRTQFSKQQVDTLEAVFQKSHYPEVHVVDRLSDKLGLSIERISVWFQNRRAKYKKTKKPSASEAAHYDSNLVDSLFVKSNFHQY
ncbi:paired box Pax-6 isoform X3 [Brachionus plicatilis]|uniref:Paired box Pax-6 isoform X3 n=1 Tax=Brachionus plicatilis TaxID=10195 RepID=A0A3M7T6H1_BRAPC|nr:paired box Pax-6 isoform X3 [Brachionus plicatilis]